MRYMLKGPVVMRSWEYGLGPGLLGHSGDLIGHSGDLIGHSGDLIGHSGDRSGDHRFCVGR